ncbi:ABC transporter [Anaerosporobacter sp.]
MHNFIEIKNARIHNLQGVDVKIPKNKLTVITGVSGSGKSSLAFDTLYEEGKKRYLTFSGSQFTIDHKEIFDSITGLSPTVAVEQRIIRQSNPRSTVGTRINIDAMLAALFANYGVIEDGYDDGIPLEIANFQKNSPKGMCTRCRGAGSIFLVEEDEIFKELDVTIENLFYGNQTHYSHLVGRFEKIYDISRKRTLRSLSEEEFRLFKYGDGGGFSGPTGFMGVIPWLMESYKYQIGRGKSTWITELDYVGMRTCPKCHGVGLGTQALHTTIAGKNIVELEDMYVSDIYKFLKEYAGGKNQLVVKILEKLEGLMEVGLSHLALTRKVPTLSGGELQRIFLASYIMAEMDSIIFVFDEPTIGLHEIEKENLIRLLKRLVENGNTVVAVEHDEGFMKNADYIIDMGPGAGVQGGKKIFEGTLEEFLKCEESRTAPYLTEKSTFPVKREYRETYDNEVLRITNATLHNLKNVDVTIPLGVMVGVAGVSGSGKSSLITDTLVPKLKEILKKKCVAPEEDSPEEEENNEDKTRDTILSGTEHLKSCFIIDQKPIGRNKTSCPATYTGILDRIRSLFANTEEAKSSNYTVSMFTRNSEGGCSRCKGEGILHHYVGYGNFIDLICDDCVGTGYIAEAREVFLDGKNICDVLNMSVDEAREYFEDKDKGISDILEIMQQVGMGYITLGQAIPTISGGESQRIKLAKELSKGKKTVKKGSKGSLYILDEPTTGLSLYDTEKLLLLLNELVDCGNTIIITEHDLHVLSNCDYIIEMGQGGGKEGGEIIAVGTPRDLKNNSNSVIGRYLL